VPLNPPLVLRAKNPRATRRTPAPIEKFTGPGGVQQVRVPLFGHGTGYSMVLDEADWLAVRERGWPEQSRVLKSDTTNRIGYVISSSRPVANGRRPTYLSRFIMDAQPGEIIRFRSGDEFDLSRANLERVPAPAPRWQQRENAPSTEANVDVPW
jgi:hypothetical protein